MNEELQYWMELTMTDRINIISLFVLSKPGCPSLCLLSSSCNCIFVSAPLSLHILFDFIDEVVLYCSYNQKEKMWHNSRHPVLIRFLCSTDPDPKKKLQLVFSDWKQNKAAYRHFPKGCLGVSDCLRNPSLEQWLVAHSIGVIIRRSRTVKPWISLYLEWLACGDILYTAQEVGGSRARQKRVHWISPFYLKHNWINFYSSKVQVGEL